jgi:hypothetical protein
MKCFIVAIFCLLLPIAAQAATTTLLPMPEAQFFDSNGLPLSGGQVYTCQPGTTCGPGSVALKSTYTDNTGVTPNSNPVILDVAGRGNIWLTGFYKIALYDSLGNMIYTVDNVSSAGAGAGGSGVLPLFFDATSLPVTKDLTGLTEVVVVKIDATSNTVTLIDTSGALFAGGSTSYTLYVGNESVHLIKSGAVWYREY